MRKQIDISGYLISRFRAKYRNANWRFDCPFCGADRDRFSVSIVKGITHCWKCNYTKSVIQFVCDYESVSFTAAFRIIQKYVKVRPKMPYREAFRGAQRAPQLPGFVGLQSGINGTLAGLAIRYLKNRGLGQNDIKMWGLGISTDEKYIGRVISPFYENGKVVYFVARKFAGGGPKYLNPPLENWGAGKAELLYNVEMASQFDTINIVEGVYDVYGAGRNSIALLGKQISQIQLSKILMLNPKQINIILDADAHKEAYELAGMIGELIPTKIVRLTSGDPASRRVSLHGTKGEDYSLRELVRNKIDTT